MLRKIIIVLAIAGIAYYAQQIYTLRDRVSLDAKPSVIAKDSMLLKFSMDTTDVDLMENCRKLFDQPNDVVTLTAHPKDDQQATLKVERRFAKSALADSLALRKRLQTQGCLKNESDVFALEVLPTSN